MQSIKEKTIFLNPGVQLKFYGAEAVLFHAGTGDTILLNADAASLVQILLDAKLAVSVNVVVERLAHELRLEPDEDFSADVESLLAGFLVQEVIALL